MSQLFMVVERVGFVRLRTSCFGAILIAPMAIPFGWLAEPKLTPRR